MAGSLDKIRKSAKALVAAIDVCECRTNEEFNELFRSGASFKFSSGRAWRTKEIVQPLNDLIEACLKKFQSDSVSVEGIEVAVWQAAESDADEAKRLRTLLEYFENHLARSRNVICPNFVVPLSDEVSGLRVGDVSLRRTSDLATDHAIKGLRFVAGKGLKRAKLSKTRATVYLSPFCWDVIFRGAPENAIEAANWKIDVAVSLIRILLLDGPRPQGLYPGLGDIEAAATTPSRIWNSEVTITGDSAAFGGGSMLGFYHLEPEHIDHLATQNLPAKAEAIFRYRAKSVGERLHSAFGWMTLARRTGPHVERFLHLFTALEAMLSLDGQHAPVSETIARSAACIINDDLKAREAIFRRIKSKYAKRSDLVHRGNRSQIFVRNARNLQQITEAVAFKILKEVDLTTSFEEFAKGLTSASFGHPWR